MFLHACVFVRIFVYISECVFFKTVFCNKPIMFLTCVCIRVYSCLYFLLHARVYLKYTRSCVFVCIRVYFPRVYSCVFFKGNAVILRAPNTSPSKDHPWFCELLPWPWPRTQTWSALPNCHLDYAALCPGLSVKSVGQRAVHEILVTSSPRMLHSIPQAIASPCLSTNSFSFCKHGRCRR